MDKVLEDYINSRPQRLCHMCGKCCRVVTSEKTYAQLLQDAKNQNASAQEFLKIFAPYSSIDEARKVSSETVENIVNSLKIAELYDESNLTFYKCRYINEDNSCSIYDSRPDLCKLFPSSPFAVIPPGCGFEGWQFQQKESVKQRVRKLKENLLELEVMLQESKNKEEIEQIQNTIESTQRTLDKYTPYGADKW